MRKNKEKKKKKHILLKIIVAILIISILGLLLCYAIDKPHAHKRTVLREKTSFEKLSNNIVKEKNVKLKGNNNDTITILVYMNGSNLESDDGSATADLSEMVQAGSSNNVNIIVQTMGTKKWDKKFGISEKRSQIYEVNGSGLKLVKDDLGQLDCTKEKTFTDFIKWGVNNYPADRYMLILWDHGGGPVYGFGYDEYVADESAALTIDEIRNGIKNANVYFDMIGFDACLMSCLEVSSALYNYCDYLVVSEDFEPGIGWYYTNWIKALHNNSSTTTVDLGKMIVDDTVNANKTDRYGDECIMSLIDTSGTKVLFKAWTEFAYANEDKLLDNNYSRATKSRGRILPSMSKGFSDWLTDDEEDYSLADYFITDIMALASTINSTESKALSSAVNNTVIYMNKTSGIQGLTGISVTLPYGDSSFYNSLKEIYGNIGIDSNYITWLNKFVSASGSSSYYNYSSWDNSWSGWDDYDDDYNWQSWDYSDNDYWNDNDYGWDDWEYDDYDDGGFFGWLYDLFWGDDYYDDDYYYYDDYYYDDYDDGGFFGWLFDLFGDDDYYDDYGYGHHGW